jgi:hypothetical protein
LFVCQDSRHEDFQRPLWELYQTSVSRAVSPELTVHLQLQRSFVEGHGEEEQVGEPPGEDCEAGATAADQVEEATADGLLDPAEEERIRRLEESNQEQGELMRLHFLQYGHGSTVQGLDQLRAHSSTQAPLPKPLPSGERDMPHDSFAFLASVPQRSREQVCQMFTALVTEAMDTFRPIVEELSQQMQGQKYKSKIRTMGATTSYCQMKPGVLRAMDLALYVGEEAGEVSEYQLLALLSALHRAPWPECDDDGRDRHAHTNTHTLTLSYSHS